MAEDYTPETAKFIKEFAAEHGREPTNAETLRWQLKEAGAPDEAIQAASTYAGDPQDETPGDEKV